MSISAVEKCSICRHACKSDFIKAFCKFYPKEELLGWKGHFTDPNNKKHESTSRMCVVCQEYFNYRNMHWKHEPEGWYPMCKNCVKTALFIDETVHK
jgi:hypothetical protein